MIRGGPPTIVLNGVIWGSVTVVVTLLLGAPCHSVYNESGRGPQSEPTLTTQPTSKREQMQGRKLGVGSRWFHYYIPVCQYVSRTQLTSQIFLKVNPPKQGLFHSKQRSEIWVIGTSRRIFQPVMLITGGVSVSTFLVIGKRQAIYFVVLFLKRSLACHPESLQPKKSSRICSIEDSFKHVSNKEN